MEFRDQGTEDIFDGVDTPRARKTLPFGLHDKAAGLLDRLNAATMPGDLRVPRGNRLHRLERDRAGQWSVAIND